MNDVTADPKTLARIADALERLAPARAANVNLSAADAFVWHADGSLAPVSKVAAIPLDLLCGIDRARDMLLSNTRRFASRLPANNALLWGARGMGKSSLVKAIHAHVNASPENDAIGLVEIHREDIPTLPDLLAILRGSERRFILFCDDLSFDTGDSTYKSLKAVLEGGIEGRPENVVFYATSNRRHLLPRDMMENERSSAINPADVVEEKVSLSDRFGLWIGFHSCDQKQYLQMVNAYAAHYELKLEEDQLKKRALEWSQTRGARSGRVAWQFIQDLAGRLGVVI